ncbi:hypothetical protein ASG60_06695 [Methylobacterium sp. Leaf469]|uniref:TerB family tellurite resistance protein n=1 Tax=unclassified Methylobacterium TaxID=2615210 RepID=UPI0007011FDB|nr:MULTISPECIES: TerB family tellurite resistance protein [unclassified Methylobacterium]KQO72528.1 hypothetical protein ASF22_12355 [Methylobacterium sp. Leaf87]KQP24151.1 hypothetical protein ASF25_08560 [Methylobacterium sp. Leaf100]KQP60309.1 hypothetical protein ASF52_08180 [Methylobacterium sp. Leaf112]KQT93090.1 hypothetical protein ASG60_06695 [Methylobacterium sp. Leaf469]
MPILLLALAIVAGVVFWVLRVHGTVSQLREVDRDTKGLQRRARSAFTDFFGSPLQRVNDVRLAAVILLIQIVRTGSPITAAEKTRILEVMETPLEIERISQMFERAWTYTQPRHPFSQIADPLVPLLKAHLTEAERLQFVELVRSVASAHSAPSELQREALIRLKRRLVADRPILATSRTDGHG